MIPASISPTTTGTRRKRARRNGTIVASKTTSNKGKKRISIKSATSSARLKKGFQCPIKQA
jgi:hypothetical protein